MSNNVITIVEEREELLPFRFHVHRAARQKAAFDSRGPRPTTLML